MWNYSKYVYDEQKKKKEKKNLSSQVKAEGLKQ